MHALSAPCAATRTPSLRLAPLRRSSQRAAAARATTASSSSSAPIVILPGLGNAAEDYTSLSEDLSRTLGVVVRTAQARAAAADTRNTTGCAVHAVAVGLAASLRRCGGREA
jgi:hypothetical protein